MGFKYIQSYGTGAIASGATSTTITHGLSFTPAVGQINVSPSATTTSAAGMIWVDTIGGKTFNVNCATDPSTSGLSFGWEALIGDK